MRSGKENGISFPMTTGTTGQVLVSNGNGVISWSSALSNVVTLDGTQTVSGSKTYTAATTTFGTSGTAPRLTTPASTFVIEQTGSASGTSRLTMVNDTDQQGAKIEQLGSLALVDLVFSTTAGNGNLRFEKRPSSFMDAGNSSYEFQFGPATAPAFSFGDTVSQVNSPTLKINGSTVFHEGNVGGDAGDILYRTSSGISGASNANIENGYLRILAGMPNATAAGGVIIGAKDLAGRIMPAFMGPAGLDVTAQANLGRNRIAQIVPVVGSTSPTLIGQTLTPTGTATARTPAITNFFTSLPRVGYVAASATGSIAGFRTTPQWWRGSITNAGGFFYSCTFAITNSTQLASGRAFVGLHSATSTSNSEPTALTNCIGMARTVNSNNWVIYGANGSTNSTLINLGTNFPCNTISSDFYRLTLFAAPSGSSVGWRVERINAIDSATGQPYTASGVITNSANLPVNSVFLAAHGWSSTGTLTASAGFDLINLYVETDN